MGRKVGSFGLCLSPRDPSVLIPFLGAFGVRASTRPNHLGGFGRVSQQFGYEGFGLLAHHASFLFRQFIKQKRVGNIGNYLY